MSATDCAAGGDSIKIISQWGKKPMFLTLGAPPPSPVPSGSPLSVCMVSFLFLKWAQLIANPGLCVLNFLLL